MIKNIIAWIVLIGSIVGGLYISGWLMFIQPIIEACKAFDASTLTGLMVGTTILKCIFASAVGYMIFSVGLITANKLFK